MCNVIPVRLPFSRVSWQVTLAKVDIDHNQDLAMKYSVSSIPHVCAFIGGKPTANFVGAVPESAVEEFINSALAK